MVEVCTVFYYSSCGYVPRDNRFVYMTHVVLSVVVTVWGSVESLLCSGRCFKYWF